MLTDSSVLWSQVMWGKYGIPLLKQQKQRSSYIWKSILVGVDLVYTHIKRKPKDRGLIKFWLDPWLNDRPLAM